MTENYDYDAAAEHRRQRDLAARMVAEDVLRAAEHPDDPWMAYSPETYPHEARHLAAFKAAQEQVERDDAEFLGLFGGAQS